MDNTDAGVKEGPEELTLRVGRRQESEGLRWTQRGLTGTGWVRFRLECAVPHAVQHLAGGGEERGHQNKDLGAHEAALESRSSTKT